MDRQSPALEAESANGDGAGADSTVHALRNRNSISKLATSFYPYTPHNMSSARFFQVLRQAASDALLKDLSVLKPAVEVLKAQKTTSIFAGTQLQQPNLFLAIGWESAEDHAAFKASSTYQDFVSALKPALASSATTDTALVRFAKDPLVALKAPVTEFLWLSPKEEAKAEDLEEAVQGIEGIFPGAIAEKLSFGGFGGKYVDTGDYLLLGGWTGPEVKSCLLHTDEELLY
ncbi:hypothetical protein PENSPDRAFT_258528 [Peniophora sp. CONT]|nr:hypothetical protein PENSPDRAFT_258528 [Peniophora sp. CONT]